MSANWSTQGRKSHGHINVMPELNVSHAVETALNIQKGNVSKLLLGYMCNKGGNRFFVGQFHYQNEMKTSLINHQSIITLYFKHIFYNNFISTYLKLFVSPSN